MSVKPITEFSAFRSSSWMALKNAMYSSDVCKSFCALTRALASASYSFFFTKNDSWRRPISSLLRVSSSFRSRKRFSTASISTRRFSNNCRNFAARLLSKAINWLMKSICFFMDSVSHSARLPSSSALALRAEISSISRRRAASWGSNRLLSGVESKPKSRTFGASM